MATCNLDDFWSVLDRPGDARIHDLSGGSSKALSFSDLAGRVRGTIHLLRRCGVSEGSTVAVQMANRIEWLDISLALINLNCTLLAIPDGATTDQVAGWLDEFGASLFVVDEAPRSISGGYTQCLDTPDLIGRAREVGSVVVGDCRDTPLLSFTSGSTGLPKCIKARRAGLEALIDEVLPAFGIGKEDRFLIFLPMASYQQYFLAFACLWAGASIGITTPGRLIGALHVFRPSILLAPPAMYDAIASKFSRLPFWKKATAFVLIAIARASGMRFGARIRKIVQKPIVSFFGGSIRLMITGMAPSRAHTMEVFRRLQLCLLEVYGTTETGIISWNTPSATRVGSVGRPLADVHLEFSAEGDISVRRESMPTSGYAGGGVNNCDTWKDGTIETGDVGHIDQDGYLFLTGRRKNIIVLPDGAKIHPEVLESKLSSHERIQQCVVFPTDAHGGIVCVVVTDTDSNEDEIKRHVKRTARLLPPGCSMVRIVVTSERFSRENGLLTANLKFDRAAISREFESRR